jgi:hypothetical protein
MKADQFLPFVFVLLVCNEFSVVSPGFLSSFPGFLSGSTGCLTGFPSFPLSGFPDFPLSGFPGVSSVVSPMSSVIFPGFFSGLPGSSGSFLVSSVVLPVFP